MTLTMHDRYRTLLDGPVLWEADGRVSRTDDRPGNVAYRESLHATYTGPYTLGKTVAWDGLESNTPGMVGTDPERGFVLTMPAGEAEAGSYTTRDLASAPHGVDYGPHLADWRTDPSAHPNLVTPGRTALFEGVRFESLALGAELRGTGGCCLQDWSGLDVDTMAVHGNTAKSTYCGMGLAWLPADSRIARLQRLIRPLSRRRDPFSASRPGVAPLNLVMARDKGWVRGRQVTLDPAVPHDIAMHWTADGRAVEAWIDGHLALTVREGSWALPMGTQTGGRVRFNDSAFHACTWHDNGSGDMDVTGTAGHPTRDSVFSVARLAILGPAA